MNINIIYKGKSTKTIWVFVVLIWPADVLYIEIYRIYTTTNNQHITRKAQKQAA